MFNGYSIFFLITLRSRQIPQYTKEKINKKLTNLIKSVVSFFVCDPGGGRTHDPQIKSLLLYQLSYEVIRNCLFRLNSGAKLVKKLIFCTIFSQIK